MPYIKQETRDALQKSGNIQTAGELNYVISKVCNLYFKERGDYQSINDVVGALEGAKLEFYRKLAAPYEDIKCHENGDVYA